MVQVMHEFSLASALCEIVVAEARAHRAVRVNTVRCAVGVMRQVVPELMRTAFAACAEGTLAAGAILELEVEPVQVACRACSAKGPACEIVHRCSQCGSGEVELSGGADLIVAAIDIEQEADDGNRSTAASASSERRHGG
jgi:hydrogenase nickel incorporation protein HypA/HybF